MSNSISAVLNYSRYSISYKIKVLPGGAMTFIARKTEEEREIRSSIYGYDSYEAMKVCKQVDVNKEVRNSRGF